MKRILALLLLVPLPLLAQQARPPVGQVASSMASVDGLAVPSGTTILDGSRVVTHQQAATIHLINGRIVRVNSNSTALFARAEDGSVQIVAERGTVSVRDTDGSTSTIAPSQQSEETAKGAKTAESEPGVVALIYGGTEEAERAEAGSSIVPVNDATRVDSDGVALLKTNLDRKEKPEYFRQEVVCSIRSATGCIVKTGELLSYTFDPDDFVIQQGPVLENRVYTQLRGSTLKGSTLLSVLDSKAINPLEAIAIQSVDGRFREPACVKSTTEELPDDLDKIIVDRTLKTRNLPESLVKIKEGLRHDYSRGADIIQGLRFTDERVVAKLAGNLGLGATVVEVEDASGIDPLQQILLRNPDGTRMEAYCIASIEVQNEDKPDRVTLAEGLDRDFPRGSDLIQGQSSQEMAAAGRSIQRLADCDCCRDELVPVTYWWDSPVPWLIGGGAAGAAIRVLADEDEPASPSKPVQ